MTDAEQWAALTLKSFAYLLSVLDHSAGGNLKFQRLQEKAAMQLLAWCK